MVADLIGTEYSATIVGIKECIDNLEVAARNKSEIEWRNNHISPSERFEYLKRYGKPKTFNDKSSAWHEFLEEKIEWYRQIFEQLELCAKDLKYFRKDRLKNLAKKKEDKK